MSASPQPITRKRSRSRAATVAAEPTAAALRPAQPAQAAETVAAPKGKLGAVIQLLRRPEGATIADLMAATAWQAHSVRGAIAGAVKKKHGLTVTSEKTDAGRVYRVVADAVS